jgi:hypothetical protein
MFVVATATFRLLYALVVLGHDRRTIIHFDVTQNPTQVWLSRQMIEVFEMRVSSKDILGAFEFVSADAVGEHQAFLCKQSGKVYWYSELSDDSDELPDDVGDSEKYVQIPDKRELDLGKPLALNFARQFLPNDFDEVRQIFSRRSAYSRFKVLSDRRGALDQWYDFEAKAEERALRVWCDLNSNRVFEESRGDAGCTGPLSPVLSHVTPSIHIPAKLLPIMGLFFGDAEIRKRSGSLD